jgi:hypothetical protein
MSDSGVWKKVLKGESVTDSRGGGWEDPTNDGDWIGTVRLTESGERRELLSVLAWKSCGEEWMRMSLVRRDSGHSQKKLRVGGPEGRIWSWKGTKCMSTKCWKVLRRNERLADMSRRSC